MQKLEFKVIGNGKPLVFFNGFRMHFQSWVQVYTEFETKNKIILYNRSGIGLSQKANCKQTAQVVIESFENLMLQLNIENRCVIVAHSLGGIYANLLCRIKPERVSGLVLVESPHPLEIKLQKEVKIPFLINYINEGVKKVEKIFDQYKFSEDECIEESIIALEQAPKFPEIPVAVVTGTKKMPFVPETSFQVHFEHQKKLLQLSSNSKQFLCENSGHFPQVTEPKSVVSAIEYILNFRKS